jgi:phosphoenolpyruvate carboxylase
MAALLRRYGEDALPTTIISMTAAVSDMLKQHCSSKKRA